MEKLIKIIRSNKFIFNIAEKVVDFSRWLEDNTINRFYWNIYSRKPMNKSKIVICNYYGRGYSDNAKYIVNDILARKLDYDIVWLVSNMRKCEEFPNGVRLVKYNTKDAIYEMATAKMWIDNSRKLHYTKKRENQLYIQTWHGGIALKKIEKDAEDALFKSYVKYAKLDSKNADLFISNSKFITNLYRQSFWYSGEILESGVPRNDILFNNQLEINNKVKNFLGIPNNKKIIMYAPTFRKDNNMQVYKFDYERCIEEFEKKFSNEYVMLIRLHPNIFNRSTELNLNSERIVNASFYPDMQELLVATDILITDYSSSMFDFALTKKPCFIYASDIDSYSDERGFYFDLSKLPFVISTDDDMFIKNIKSFHNEQYVNAVNEFLISVGCTDDGNASKKVVKWIESKM